MTTISPTRVSMYDFLYQDTQPMVSLLADIANLSIPQARLAMDASLQAIISALLAYQQQHQAQVLSKKLFARSAVKELRRYNSMNSATVNATLYYRQEVANVLFQDPDRVQSASEYIAKLIKANRDQVQTLLTSLSVIALRELAILTEYSQLDFDEINKWFAIQPQFLSTTRFTAAVEAPSFNTETSAKVSHRNEKTDQNTDINQLATADSDLTSQSNSENTDLDIEPLASKSQETAPIITPPPFNPFWYELTRFNPIASEPVQDSHMATGHYLKVIGRSDTTTQQGQHDDSLMFAPMDAIAVPQQRWLLQLAKISDIYLSRQRLRITSEPATAPTAPLVSLGRIGNNSEDTPATTSEKPIEYDKPLPLWKNPVILLTLLVISVLSVLAFVKYNLQQVDNALATTQTTTTEIRQQQDVAIVKVEESETKNTTAD